MLEFACYAIAGGFFLGSFYLLGYGLYLWSQKNVKDHSELRHD